MACELEESAAGRVREQFFRPGLTGAVLYDTTWTPLIKRL
jgi:hypothetical protein